jgi:hypothetical protein
MLVLLTIGAAVLGAFIGALLGAVITGRRLPDAVHQVQDEPIDEYTAAAIDQAAVNYAATHGRPEVAPLLADKLHLLHKLARRRGR